VDIRDCPFDRRLDTMIAEAQVRVERQLVDEDDFDDERRGMSAQILHHQLQSTRPKNEDLVMVHGDYCLPNILLHPQTLALTGFIDWGRSGIADRYQDLALAARSIVRNLSERWVGHFFDAYGLQQVSLLSTAG
jgi:aminoglycoside phosphotransferase